MNKHAYDFMINYKQDKDKKGKFIEVIKTTILYEN